MRLQFSQRLQNRVALVAEFSGHPIRVTLVLMDGRRVHHVTISRDSVIERIGDKVIREEADLGFLLSQIQDLDLDLPDERDE